MQIVGYCIHGSMCISLNIGHDDVEKIGDGIGVICIEIHG